MRHASRAGIAAAAVAVLVFLSGCVYLRLLDIKRQLVDFDKNFLIGGRAELVVEFLQPALYQRDARFLIGAPPLGETLTEEGTLDHFEFFLHRSSASTPPPFDRLSLDLAYRDKKLVKIIVPENFLMLFSRNVLVETLKQAKDAAVYEMKRLARAKIILSPEVEAELPSRSRTEFLLGSPTETISVGEDETWIYRFGVVTELRPVPIVGRLTFNPDGLLKKAVVRWDSSTVEAEFVRS